ncbi:MAG TPA: T9SS type A sorting domain-containing protein [Cryomorphaceae bacterium]|nr:T9SS type A sorting domain-containing protein [Cryomorphaceae bacterium]
MGYMNPDTLVVQGYIAQEVTTSLDPTGNSPEVYYPDATTFIAFFRNDPTGLEEVELQKALNIYPNPTTTEISVDVRHDALFDRYIIYDSAGKSVQSGDLNTGGFTHKIPLDPMPPGVYILRCSGENGYATAKFTVY